MRSPLPVAVLILLAFGAAGLRADPVAGEGYPVPQPRVPSAVLVLATDREVAGRGDPVAFLLWLNVSGNGQLQEVHVNLSLDVPGGKDAATPLDQGEVSEPSACVRGTETATALEWRCYGLRAGSYRWRVATAIGVGTEVGRWQNGTGVAVAFSGGSSSTLRSTTSLWVAGADLDLTIASSPSQAAHAGDLVEFWINVTNGAENVPEGLESTAIAYNVSLTIVLDPLVRLGPGSAGLTLHVPSLTAGSMIPRRIETIISESAPPGATIEILVELRYEDFNLHPIGPIERSSAPIYVALGEIVSPPNLIAGAAIGLFTLIGALVVLAFLGQRKLVIDEAFLMHKNGILLHRASRVATDKDEDLVASMFVAVQEFLRDSFAREAFLDEVSFGRRRAAVVRGDHVVLAAIISRGEIEYLIPEMLAAVRAVEAAYGPVLAMWDGRMARLEGIEGIMDRFLAGGFRGAWRVKFA